MSWHLHLGDALSAGGLVTLHDASVDVTITDPPFDARVHAAAVEAGDWRQGKREVKGALPFPPLTGEQLVLTAHQIARVTRRWICIFCGETQIDDWRRALEDGGARFVRLGLAERTNPRPQLSGDRPAPPADFIIIAHAPTKGRMRWNGGGRPARWASAAARFDHRDRELRHPTQKALALMRSLVSDFSEVGEIVCDPFAGSGTTAVACREVGRSFVGWEIDPVFCATAADRIERAREQLILDAVASPAPEQLALVKP